MIEGWIIEVLMYLEKAVHTTDKILCLKAKSSLPECLIF